MASPAPALPFRCDFCGQPVARVRRVALDRDYDRLGARHPVRYACPECSRRKEAERSAAAVLDAPTAPL